MEVHRFRVLFLSLLACTVLPGCSLLGGRDADRPEPLAPATSAESITGEPLDLQEPARENYMSRRWQGGIMGGDFDGASEVSLFGGYAFSDNLSIELTLTHILGEFSNGYSATLGLMHLFAPEWRLSPYFTLGTGILYTDPKSNLVQSIDRDDQIGYVGGGLQFYLTRRFMLRSEYRHNIVFTSRNDNEEVDEWKYLGFAFFF